MSAVTYSERKAASYLLTAGLAAAALAIAVGAPQLASITVNVPDLVVRWLLATTAVGVLASLWVDWVG